jgi:hypothetical protein
MYLAGGNDYSKACRKAEVSLVYKGFCLTFKTEYKLKVRVCVVHLVKAVGELQRIGFDKLYIAFT